MKTALLALFSVVLAQAAVDGTVTNATTNNPQAGASVALQRLTQKGPEELETVKAGPDGKFAFTKDVQPGQGGGPLMVQATYEGVQYFKVITPGQPTSGIALEVYESSAKPGDAQMQQHFMVLEPDTNGTMTVDEVYVFQNSGKTTWDDSKNGTLQFQLPAAADGKVDVQITAPGGLPIRRDASPAGKPNEFKIDFPIKPGESRIETHWAVPFKTPGAFDYRVLAKGGPTRIVAPDGITFEGDGISAAGQEPTTKATIYTVAMPASFKVNISGVAVQQADNGGGQGNGQGNAQGDDAQNNGSPSLTENLPRLFGLTVAGGNMWQSMLAVKWVLLSVIGMLAIGFVLLYRKGTPSPAAGASESETSESKPRHARSRG